ncbi:mechanosensitive ion channel [Cereibacter sphaeroides]|nr:mechanosensitive ion channel [Cereibacter sphaeroides]
MTFLRTRIALMLILALASLGVLPPASLQAQTGLLPSSSTTSETDAAPATETATPSSLDLLLNVIEDDQARAALIDELRAAQGAAAQTPADQVVETLAGDNAVPPESLSFSRRVALITQQAVEDISTRAATLWTQLTRTQDALDGLSGREAGVLWTALQELALIIVSTVAVFLVLRRIGKTIYARMGAKAAESGFIRTVALFLGSALIDAFIVIIAWAVGYLIATLFIGQVGTIGIRQTLYLNAFLLVELAKVVVRMVLSPSTPSLRLIRMSDDAARYTTARLNLMVGLIGYGQLLVVPIINQNVSYAAGSAVSVLIALLVMGLAFWLVLRNRKPVAEWLERGGQSEADYQRTQEMAAQAEREAAEEEAAQAAAAQEAARALAERQAEAGGAPNEFTMSDTAAEEAAEEQALVAEQAAADERAAREAAAEQEAARIAAGPAVVEGPEKKRGPLAFLARNWHWPALLYLFSMTVIVLSQPGNAAFRAMANSGQMLLAVLIGLMLSGVLTRAMVRGVQLPDNVTARLPLLEKRLNTFVPKALFVLRMVIFVLVVAFALNAISLIDLRGWLASQIGLRLTSTLFSVAAVLLVSFVVWVALTSWVDYRLNPEFGTVATARERTLLTLLRNAATIALIIITLMFVLSEVGLDIAPLLASAGVLGLAIGFGAQKMVQDIITGIFIQFENAMNVGDVVTVSGTTGVVERLTIRSVSLRDVTGAFHVIPFSSVDMVTNFMRDFGYFVCDMGVAYRENIAEVKQAMLDGFEELRRDTDHRGNILGDLEWFGINSFGDSAIVCRARIKCVPGTQWGVGRAYNGVLKEIFDARGIEIPFPHQTLYLGESKKGETQPFRLLVEKDEAGLTG